MAPFIILIFFLLYSPTSFSAQIDGGDDAVLKTASDLEKLIVVQAISTTQKTFVLRLGRAENITPGVRALFSTEKVSVVGECIEASREYSLWKPWEPLANIPFKKGQIITYNNNLDSIWYKIPELKDTLEEKKQALLMVPEPYWIFRYSVAKTFQQSTTETDAELGPDRKAQQMELTYNKHLYRRLDWGFGVRYDQETATIKETSSSPNLTIPSNRYYLIGEVTFNFDKLKKTMNNMYAGIGTGIGYSTTKVDSAISTGTAILFPLVRVGFLTNLKNNWSLLTEVVGEAIGTREKFSGGDVQTTNIMNAKITIGLRF